MKYYSTNGHSHLVSLEDAVLKGFADDQGLYMPEIIPQLPQAFVSNLKVMSLPEMSYAVANYALRGDVEAEVLHNIVFDTLNFDIPLVEVAPQRFSLELFHGPTMGFKDVGARFMGRLLSHYTGKHNHDIHVLIATSGNAGGAVACGFYNIPGVHVYVLYPQDTLDNLQEAQFTTLGGNITAIEVNGTLDDCKNMVMQAFNDEELNHKLTLTSAKTANIARLLPQTFYYFYAYAQIAKQGFDAGNVVFAVPCGNLGNITAGLMAKKMGLPVKRFIATNNKNNVFTHYLNTGKFAPQQVVPSIAPGLDIGNPRNFKRILDLYPSHEQLSSIVQGMSYTDEQIAHTIATAWNQDHYLFDPHGATAYRALNDCLDPSEVGIALETAHPAKFFNTVESIVGNAVEVPNTLSKFLYGTRHVTSMNSGFTALKKFLLKQSQL